MPRRLLAFAFAALFTATLTGAGAQAMEVAGPGVPQVELSCDPTGDGSADDCIRHGHHKTSADHVLHGDEQLVVRAHAHQSLHGIPLISEVQYRAIDFNGKPTGKWTTAQTYTWTPTKGANGHARKNFTVCPPSDTGLFEVRKKVTMPKAGTDSRMRDVRSSNVMTSLASVIAANGGNCAAQETNEDIVEYYNQLIFMENFYFQVQTGNDSSLSFVCELGSFTPSNFSLVLSSSDGSASTPCNGAPIKTAANNGWCSADMVCRVNVTLTNSATSQVLASTEANLWLKVAGLLIPELNPASAPLCIQPVVDACLLDNSCALPSDPDGQLQLCESADNCLQAQQPSHRDIDPSSVVFTTSDDGATPDASPSVSPSPTPSASPPASPSPTSTPDASADPSADPSPSASS